MKMFRTFPDQLLCLVRLKCQRIIRKKSLGKEKSNYDKTIFDE